ncbi:hypothetical protein AVEN_172793-1 [Araneus ventricosus]|uniref:Uncharacterized protein n=1 Tax=Araneus ventricosus TaxID=182803 RepID=A0A4Y2BI25_ARAVE|nr:hypothetical protein AVEN_172793-1 [Araneus ventricosus]
MASVLAAQAQDLDLLEKFPTLKKSDEKKYRAMMNSFIGIINRQQRVIDMLKGQLQEQRDLFEKRPAHMVSSAPSFAAVTMLSRSRSKSRLREDGRFAMIYPKNDMESRHVEAKIQAAINPAKLKVGIQNVRNLKKGGIMIECGNDEISKLKEENESNEALKDDLEFHHPVKKNPKIIIYRVEDYLIQMPL